MPMRWRVPPPSWRSTHGGTFVHAGILNVRSESVIGLWAHAPPCRNPSPGINGAADKSPESRQSDRTTCHDFIGSTREARLHRTRLPLGGAPHAHRRCTDRGDPARNGRRRCKGQLRRHGTVRLHVIRVWATPAGMRQSGCLYAGSGVKQGDSEYKPRGDIASHDRYLEVIA